MPTATDEFVCPECQAPLSATGDGLSCSGCPAWYAVLHGVPLLLPGVTVGQGPMPDQDFVEEIARIAVPADGTAARESLRDLFSKRIAFPDPRLGIEGHRFLHRLRSSGFTVRNPDGSAPETAKADKPAGPAEGVARIGLTLLTAPAAVVAGRRFWVQVRIVNQGSATLRCEGPEAFHFRYSVAGPIPFWRLRQSLRTPLLVDLPPGGELTQPVLLQAGSRSGRRDYRVTAAAGGKRRLRGASLRVGVEVLPETAADPLDVDWPQGTLVRDYGADHRHGVELLGGWLRDRFAFHAAPRVLELGGNCAPMLAAAGFALPGARRFNLDIDPFGLVFGTVQRRLGGGGGTGSSRRRDAPAVRGPLAGRGGHVRHAAPLP